MALPKSPDATVMASPPPSEIDIRTSPMFEDTLVQYAVAPVMASPTGVALSSDASVLMALVGELVTIVPTWADPTATDRQPLVQ
jgi:hypothetical protein